MHIRFYIHYKTEPGQHICVSGSTGILGEWNTENALNLHYSFDGEWSAETEVPDDLKLLEYKYILKDQDGNVTWEWGLNRRLDLTRGTAPLTILRENWRSPSNEEKVMYSAAFSHAVMKPRVVKSQRPSGKKTLEFRISVPRIGEGYRVCVLGSHEKLGNWDPEKPLLLGTGEDFPEWSGGLSLKNFMLPVEYKYGIYDTNTGRTITLEEGENRRIDHLPGQDSPFRFIRSDESFRYPLGNWKGAGVSVPVFSLRSERGFGVGDFTDLSDFIDWASGVGMKMVQILPVNETIASHNWLDSYPYKSISVMALHPIYMDIEKLGGLKDLKAAAEFETRRKELNALQHVDYPAVLKEKSRYFKLMYDQQKDTFFDQEDYKAFFAANREWLVPYAAFVYLRDRMKSPDFRAWKHFNTYDKREIEKMSTPGSDEWDDIAVHYYIQYHLDKQLKEVSAHARRKGIVLKGDIPIGISPNSVEAWTLPHLFHLDVQAGAPPDAFAVKGQNWGFPTYNWEAMAKDGYRWWRARLQKMADYFDAYRIDHILGFFRIWEIPIEAVEGVLGYFNPALPMSADEIREYGVYFDYDRMVKPYIRHHLLHDLFGEYAGEVVSKYLEPADHGTYRMKKAFNTQLKVNSHFLSGVEEEDLSDKDRRIRNGLFDLIANVLFIQTGHDAWHPRISLHGTSSYTELDDNAREGLNRIYIDYYYRRHDEFWHMKGMEKLPAIIEATNMLVCGEDLGMVPDCVPPVMNQLNILSLEIQRMSKNPKVKFAHPADAPYLSVCTTSTHDMPTIRGWWEEDKAEIQEFYNKELGNEGEAPYFAEPWVCRQIITQHIFSPAMWTTFPIQDLIAMDGDLRWHETGEEQINHPSNVRHKWRYRMRQSLGNLLEAGDFNGLLRDLINASGRNSDY